MTKEAVQKVVDTLPNEVTVDDIVEHLMLIQSFDESRKQYEVGEFVTHEAVGKRLEKWLK